MRVIVARMEPLTTWTLAMLLALAPTSQRVKKYETEAEYTARVQEIAEDMVAVVEAAEPLPGMTRQETLALVMVTANAESSGFRYDIDHGLPGGIGDHGQSYCIMQVRARQGFVRTHDPVAKRWKGADLIADRRKCLSAGLALLRDSMMWCAGKGAKGATLISAYTVGRCRPEPVATARWNQARSRRFVPSASLKLARNP